MLVGGLLGTATWWKAGQGSTVLLNQPYATAFPCSEKLRHPVRTESHPSTPTQDDVQCVCLGAHVKHQLLAMPVMMFDSVFTSER